MGGDGQNRIADRGAERPPRAKLDGLWRIRVSDFPLPGTTPTPFAVRWRHPITGRPDNLAGVVVSPSPTTKTLVFVLSDTPTIKLQAAPQPRGGVRWRFICPTTGTLYAVLIRPPGAVGFVSRAALGPTSYASQRRSPRRRAADRAARIRIDLGGSADLTAPFPERPAGMRRATFARLRAEAEAAAATALAGRALPSFRMEQPL